jgi:hypothetical protein
MASTKIIILCQLYFGAKCNSNNLEITCDLYSPAELKYKENTKWTMKKRRKILVHKGRIS